MTILRGSPFGCLALWQARAVQQQEQQRRLLVLILCFLAPSFLFCFPITWPCGLRCNKHAGARISTTSQRQSCANGIGVVIPSSPRRGRWQWQPHSMSNSDRQSDDLRAATNVDPDHDHEDGGRLLLTKPTTAFSLSNQTNGNSSLCILTIDGRTYNLTDWAKAHPGGIQVLRKFHHKDASKAFHAVGHSASAHALLQTFMVSPHYDNMITLSAVATNLNSAQAVPTTTSSLLARLRLKLFTKEDPWGIHKYLGLFCLAHYMFRFFQMYLGDPSAGYGSRLGRHGARIGPALCLLPHVLLSLSSFIFHTVPLERVVGKPIIWQEYRIHNIAFSLRSAICTWFAWFSCYQQHTAPWRRIAVIGSCVTALVTSLVADEGTRRLRTNPQESTTATMPYWQGCSIQTEQRFKTFYAYSQFMGTLSCIALCNPVWPLASMFAIQGASFIMTLVRKGFVSTKASHLIYTVTLIMPYLSGIRSAYYFPHQPWFLPLFMVTGGILFQLRRIGVNKYALWIPVYVMRILYGDRVIPYQIW